MPPSRDPPCRHGRRGRPHLLGGPDPHDDLGRGPLERRRADLLEGLGEQVGGVVPPSLELLDGGRGWGRAGAGGAASGAVVVGRGSG